MEDDGTNVVESVDKTNASEKMIDTEYEILTVENCEDLANMFSITNNVDPAFKEFSETYHGRTIEFDGI